MSRIGQQTRSIALTRRDVEAVGIALDMLDKSRVPLTCLALEPGRLIATDGTQLLARRMAALDELDTQVLVCPEKGVRLGEVHDGFLRFSETGALLDFGEAGSLPMRIVEDDYPDIDSVVPDARASVIRIAYGSLKELVRHGLEMETGDENDEVSELTVSLDGPSLELVVRRMKASEPPPGEVVLRESIRVALHEETEELQTGVNLHLLHNAVRALQVDNGNDLIEMRYTDARGLIHLSVAGGDETWSAVMPMRLAEEGIRRTSPQPKNPPPGWMLPRAKAQPPDMAPSRPRTSSKVGRNAPCPCGSGRKYKRCCGAG